MTQQRIKSMNLSFLAGIMAVVALMGWGLTPARATDSAQTARPNPFAVIALIDSGINPYSVAFRDRSPIAQQPPWTYISGYPRSALRLPVTLDVPYQEALKKDAKLWASVKPRTLYWIPGTRIVGAISFAPGGTRCFPIKTPPVYVVLSGNCADRPILDEFGHGTMTASRAAGSPHSLAPDARIVEIEGLGGDQVHWAATQGWIDVQSNSWSSLYPSPVDGRISNAVLGTSQARAFAYAATRTLTLVASGNGLAYTQGVAPNPSYLLPTAAPGVIVVGGHDNGNITLWAGAPPDVVADDYFGWTAFYLSSGPMEPRPISCCTSASSPYAAGGAAAIIEDARRILGDHRTGIHDGVVARGPAHRVPAGPLADGVFTLDELRDVFLHTAEARPAEGRDDGQIHWMGQPRPPDELKFGVGGNPFCTLCTTMPVAWTDVPSSVDVFPFVGYGAINERSVALADLVLRGRQALPVRPSDDRQYERNQALRALFTGE